MSIEAMKQAYLAGFMASGEGYNGEYPFQDKGRNPENDPAWCRDRDNALRTAIEQAEKQEPVALEAVYETIIHWDEGGGKRSRRELARRIVDLYTTPPAAQPCPYIRSTAEGTHHCALSQRQPLTDEGIDAGVAAWFSTETVVGGRPFEKRMRAAIEAAHGIGEKT